LAIYIYLKLGIKHGGQRYGFIFHAGEDLGGSDFYVGAIGSEDAIAAYIALGVNRYF
jgi:hypothetical protein